MKLRVLPDLYGWRKISYYWYPQRQNYSSKTSYTMSEQSLEAQLLAAYDEHADALFRFCYVFVGDRERARDAVQETFTRTWEYIAGGKQVRQLKPFLYRTARNLLTDWSRRAPTESLDQKQEEGFDVVDPLADPHSLAASAHVATFVSRLEPAYREAVTLRYLEGMPPRDIAKFIGESENTVSVRIHRGIQRLRELLSEQKP